MEHPISVLKYSGSLEALAKDVQNNTLSGAAAFKLYDTYGFPLDLTEMYLTDKGLKLDQAGFDKAMKEGADYISTGHYVIVKHARGPVPAAPRTGSVLLTSTRQRFHYQRRTLSGRWNLLRTPGSPLGPPRPL